MNWLTKFVSIILTKFTLVLGLIYSGLIKFFVRVKLVTSTNLGFLLLASAVACAIIAAVPISPDLLPASCTIDLDTAHQHLQLSGIRASHRETIEKYGEIQSLEVLQKLVDEMLLADESVDDARLADDWMRFLSPPY